MYKVELQDEWWIVNLKRGGRTQLIRVENFPEFKAEAFRCPIKFGRIETNLSNRLGKFTECPSRCTLDLEFWIMEQTVGQRIMRTAITSYMNLLLQPTHEVIIVPHTWSTPHMRLLLYRINYCPIRNTNQVFSTIQNIKLCKNNSFLFDEAWMWEKYMQGFGRECCAKEEDSLENLNLGGRITLVEMLKK